MGKEIGITVKKSEDFSEWYTQLVIKAELADYAPVKGLIVLRPDGYSIWESLKSSLDSKLAATGHRNGFLPVLIPESLLGKEKDHFTGFNPEVFWVTRSGDGEIGDKLALRPTSETLAYTMYAKWIRSWRDLPLKINFWNSALRAEIKATKPFLRTSEFLWQEGHTAHAEKDEAEKDYREALNFYMEHRSDLEAKERCYRKGDVYFSFKFPDTFQYPMLDFDYNSEFIDNRSLREKMVEEEIKEEFKRNRSA